MDYAKHFQNMISGLAEEFDLELDTQLVAHDFCDKHADRITVCRSKDNLLSVGVFYDDQNGKLTGDPEFLLFTEGDRWYPIALSERNSNWRWGSHPSENNTSVVLDNAVIQSEIDDRYANWLKELFTRNDWDGTAGFLVPSWF
jgi:hypothetical protein